MSRVEVFGSFKILDEKSPLFSILNLNSTFINNTKIKIMN